MDITKRGPENKSNPQTMKAESGPSSRTEPNSDANNGEEKKTERKVDVPHAVAGRVIGKCHQTIRSIETKTLTVITPSYTQVGCRLTIVGTKSNLQQAVDKIEQKVMITERGDYITTQLKKNGHFFLYDRLNRDIRILDYVVKKEWVSAIIHENSKYQEHEKNPCAKAEWYDDRLNHFPNHKIFFVCGTYEQILKWCEEIEKTIGKKSCTDLCLPYTYFSQPSVLRASDMQ